MFLWFMQPDIWLTLITLTFLEIILGVDNIIFLSLVVAKLPLSQQNMARKLGLSCAMIMRILLLISIAWLSHITQPLFTVLTLEISFRTLILLGGGLFLIYKAIQEIREEAVARAGRRTWQRIAATVVVRCHCTDNAARYRV